MAERVYWAHERHFPLRAREPWGLALSQSALLMGKERAASPRYPDTTYGPSFSRTFVLS